MQTKLYKKALMNWSGGKDSALSLYHILKDENFDVQYLLTTVNDAFQRVSMHGVREELLDKQAENIGLELVKVRLSEIVSMEEYHAQMESVLAPMVQKSIEYAIFGDIFLEDLRQHREKRLTLLGMKGVFPIWKRPSLELLAEFWDLGFKTIVVSVNGNVLDKSFCGKILDRDFIKELPANIDPCGENGEFHTFVYEAPYFKQIIDFELGETVDKTYNFKDTDGKEHISTYYFTDLLPK